MIGCRTTHKQEGDSHLSLLGVAEVSNAVCSSKALSHIYWSLEHSRANPAHLRKPLIKLTYKYKFIINKLQQLCIVHTS